MIRRVQAEAGEPRDVSEPDEFVGINRAREASGWGQNRILRRVLLGEIALELKPGHPPKFSLNDLKRVIASESK